MKRYQFEIEIYEGEGGHLEKTRDRVVAPEDRARRGICAWMYKGDGERSYRVGQRFVYPDEAGKLCPWLLSSMDGFLKTLMHDGDLPWTYAGTPYEKVVDPQGVTTEFVRCPDPSASGIVVKITRTRLPD